MSIDLQSFMPAGRINEISLLLHCLRRVVVGGGGEGIRKLCLDRIDWQFIVSMATAHKVQYLFYRGLVGACPEVIDCPALRKLEERYHYNLACSYRTVKQLDEIVSLLEAGGIRAMPFKGVALSELAYRDISLRPIGDMDILVDERLAFLAITLLVNEGFRPEIELNEAQFKAFAKKKNSLLLHHGARYLSVDLHWEMSGHYSPLALGSDWIGDDLEMISMEGMEAKTSSVEKLLVYLCLHGTRDRWKDLESLASIAGLVYGCPDMDWGKVINVADRLKCRRMILLGLSMAHILFELRIPANILADLNMDTEINNLKRVVFKYLFNAFDPLMIQNRKSKFAWFHLQVREHSIEKLRYVLRMFFSATVQDWKMLNVPAQLSFLHDSLRPLRLVRNYLMKEWRSG